jgi:hypothetical protein
VETKQTCEDEGEFELGCTVAGELARVEFCLRCFRTGLSFTWASGFCVSSFGSMGLQAKIRDNKCLGSNSLGLEGLGHSEGVRRGGRLGAVGVEIMDVVLVVVRRLAPLKGTLILSLSALAVLFLAASSPTS